MNHSTPSQIEIEFPSIKLCECGCGEPAPIAPHTHKERGWIKGQPLRFVRGHWAHTQWGSPEERFWQKVDVRGSDECWEWTASTRNGYGKIEIDGTAVPAHRYSYELHYGPIPKSKNVCHHCDNPPCCNPKHLFLGTHADNVKDRNAKKRQANGIRNGNSKLTPALIRRIRTLSKNGMSLRNIANQFDVHNATIGRIITGKTWKHIK